MMPSRITLEREASLHLNSSLRQRQCVKAKESTNKISKSISLYYPEKNPLKGRFSKINLLTKTAHFANQYFFIGEKQLN
jgi:hypothetical protein